MRVPRVLVLIAAAAAAGHCARNKPSGRNEVRFENKDKELVRSKASGRAGAGHVGVLSPRPDVIGPRDMARLTATTPARWPAARRAYESEMEVPEEVHKADYEHAQRLMNNGKPSQSDVALRHNLYVRERSMRPPTAQPAIPTTLSTARGLMTPRTHSRSMPLRGPNYGSQNAFQFVSTPLVRYDVPLLDNGTPPQEADLPAFGDDPADLVAEAEFPGPTIKNNLSEATAGTNEPASVSPLSGFFKKNELTKLPDAPKKQRFENFVKFIQANKDLVQEYIKKKRWSFQASTGGENAQGEVVVVPRVVGVPRWSLDPVRHGIASPVVINRSSPKSAAAQDRTRHEAPASTKPRAAHPPGTRANPDMSQERMAEYSTTDDPKMLDMAPARGGSIPNMRLRGRICQRNVLLPEGPKYNKRGSVYLKAFQSIYEKDFPQTRAPRMLMPICCNCCRKSVLGCE